MFIAGTPCYKDGTVLRHAESELINLNYVRRFVKADGNDGYVFYVVKDGDCDYDDEGGYDTYYTDRIPEPLINGLDYYESFNWGRREL